MKIRLNLTAALLAVSLLVLCAAYRADAAPTLTAGGLLQFTSQSEFQQAFPGLPKEDFEESTIGNTAFASFPRPLNSSTSNAYFAAGDILPGLNITSTGTAASGYELGVIGGNYATWNNTSKSVMNENYFNLFTIEFTGSNVNAVGMDLVFILTTGNAEIKIYTTGNTLIDTITYTLGATPTFFGIYSSQPITKMTMAKTPNDNWVSIDNIQFGTLTPNVTFFTNQAAFEAAHPGLPKEDFEESGVADDSFLLFQSPLNSASNVPPAFVPGDIIPGLQIGLTALLSPADMVVMGSNGGPFPNDSKAVFAGMDVLDGLVIELTNYTAYAVGMDLSLTNINADATIVIYKPFGQILGVTTWSLLETAETFFGVSSNDVIAKIIILTNGGFEMVDDIQFGGSLADLTFYQTEADFRNASGTLLLEDFSEAPVPDNMANICNEPIDGSSNQPGCFAPGDILPNISFQTENSLYQGCPACMVLFGKMTGFDNTTPMIGVLSYPDLLEVSFSGRRVDFVGMKLGVTPYISVYGTDDALLGSAVNIPPASSLDFWGVVSQKPIGRITIYGAYLDDIMFGARFPWPMFLPAINGAPATP